MGFKKHIFFALFLIFSSSAFSFVRGADRYEVGLGVDVPFYTGAHFRYNFSTQYYAKLTAGWAMELLLNMQFQMLHEMSILRDKDHLLEKSLSNSVLFELSFGGAMMSIYEGPYVELGYGLMLWGRGKVTGQEIASHLGSVAGLDNKQTYQLDLMNHGPLLHLGYRFILADKLNLSVDLACYKPLFFSLSADYGEGISVPKGHIDKVVDSIAPELWFLSAGLWLGLSF